MNDHERFIERRGRRRAGEPAASFRAEAEFTDENDHNPWIFSDCIACHGRGRICEQRGPGVEHLRECETCHGTRIALTVERYFQNDNPPLDATEFIRDWVRCPACGSTFSTRDKTAWTGRRHNHRGGSRGICGQKLNIHPAPEG